MTAASKYICVASVVMGTRFLVTFTPHDDLVSFMVFNANFNNISAISWQSVLLVEEMGVPGQNNRPVTSH